MLRILRVTAWCLLFVTFSLVWGVGEPAANYLCVRSAILTNAADGQVLYEQNADTLIPPASVTKILTLYLVFDAIKQGQVHPWDLVQVSSRAANTGGSRMGLKTGRAVPLEELIKGIAVVSGNDAAVAVAEHLAGSVEDFVEKMNVKAQHLGMTNSEFKTPNGLPAKGQVTTARDLAKLSASYMRHYPEALHIHSMTSYTYCSATHHNANRLLGSCAGVDGIKTGFVCASGFNIAATAKRGDVRLIAVIMGARKPWVRTVETEKLLEAGFQKMASDSGDSGSVEEILAKRDSSGNGKEVRSACAAPPPTVAGSTKRLKHPRTYSRLGKAYSNPTIQKTPSTRRAGSVKKATLADASSPLAKPSKSRSSVAKTNLVAVKQTMPVKKAGSGEKSTASERNTLTKKSSAAQDATTAKGSGLSKKQGEPEKSTAVQVVSKPAIGNKLKPAPEPPKKSNKAS